MAKLKPRRYRDYRKMMMAHVGSLSTYTVFDAVTKEKWLEDFTKWGNHLPEVPKIFAYIQEVDFEVKKVKPIMGHTIYSLRVLRQLSSIFLIRVYVKRLVDFSADLKRYEFNIIGEKYQVMMAIRAYNHINRIWEGFRDSKRYMTYFKENPNENNSPIARKIVFRPAMEALKKFPSYRPGNFQNTNFRTSSQKSAHYTQHELKVFVFILKSFKFVLKENQINPLYSPYPIKEANFKIISDTTGKRIRGLKTDEKVIPGKLLWPGKI